MSSVSRPFFAPADLMMLGRVLDQANFKRSHVPSDREARFDAARFLIASFQRGVTSEAALGSSLSGRVASQGPSIEHSGQVDAARIFSEYLRSTKSPKIPGSKCGYGSQARVKRRRTACYLMTGIPARIPALDMIELNIKTALGALRVLNWPEGSS